MEIKQTQIFKSTYKRLFLKQRKSVDHAIRLIIENPSIGEQKKSDLSEVLYTNLKLTRSCTFWRILLIRSP